MGIELVLLHECNNLVMDTSAQNRFSGPVTVFQERRLPVTATLAGYAALIRAYDLWVPLPRILSAIGERHKFMERDGWRIYTPRYTPDASLEGHLTFALKHEGLDLAVLKRLFATTCLLYTSPSPRDRTRSRMPSSA